MKHLLTVIFLLSFVWATLANPPNIQERIVGGQNADRRQFPYIALLVSSSTPFGAASIISPSWVVSSAYAVQNMVNIDVVAGVHVRNELHSELQSRVSNRIVLHPEYISGSKNDISLIKVDRPFVYNDAVKQIPLLCNPQDLGFGKTVYTAGWGRMSGAGEAADTMQFLQMSLITQEECRTQAGGKTEITDKMLCSLASGPGRGACALDYGNPLIQYDVLIGVKTATLLDSCGGSGNQVMPDIYTNVNRYLNFIVDHVGVEICGTGPVTPSSPSANSRPTLPQDTTPDASSSLRPSLIGFVLALASTAFCYLKL